jgi:hypothetical protein
MTQIPGLAADRGSSAVQAFIRAPRRCSLGQ